VGRAGKHLRAVTPAVTPGSSAEPPAWLDRAEKLLVNLTEACDRADALLSDVRGCQGDMAKQLRTTREELVQLTGQHLSADIQAYVEARLEEQVLPFVSTSLAKTVDVASEAIHETFARLKNLLLLGNEEGKLGEFNVPGVVYEIVTTRENGELAFITNRKPDDVVNVEKSRRIFRGTIEADGE
jgi:hypothetical protein